MFFAAIPEYQDQAFQFRFKTDGKDRPKWGVLLVFNVYTLDQLSVNTITGLSKLC